MADNLIAKLMIDSTGGSNGGDQGSGEPGFMERLFKVGNEIRKNGLKGMKTSLGINLGIAAILKQSQIFTGLFGTLFQILGALADVLLMPLVPFFLPLLKLLAKAVPLVQQYAAAIVGGITAFFARLGKELGMVLGFFGIGGGDTFKSVLEVAGKAVVAALTAFGLLKVTGLWSLVKVFFKTELGAKITQKYLMPLLTGVMSFVSKTVPNFIKGLPMMIIKGIKNVILGAVETVKQIIISLRAAISKLIPNALRNFGKSITSTLGKVIEFIMKPFSGLITKIAQGLAKIPGLGGLAKGLASKAGAGAKFIPGLGAIVTAGFAAKDTFDTFREQGAAAGFARGGIGVAQTLLAAGGPLCVAGSIGLDLVADKIVNAVTGSQRIEIVTPPGMDALVSDERTGFRAMSMNNMQFGTQ